MGNIRTKPAIKNLLKLSKMILSFKTFDKNIQVEPSVFSLNNNGVMRA